MNASSSGWRGRGQWRGKSGRGRGGWQKGRGNWKGSDEYGDKPPMGRANASSMQFEGSPPTKKVRTSQARIDDVMSPYMYWKLYFHDEVYSERSAIVTRMKVFNKYFESFADLFNLRDIEEGGFFRIDFQHLTSHQDVSAELSNLAHELRQDPEVILDCLSLTMHEILLQNRIKEGLGEDEKLSRAALNTVCGRLRCRLSNFEPVTLLKQLRANYYGKFVSVRGTVVRVSAIKPICVQMAYECTSCGNVQAVKWLEGKCTNAAKCIAEECRGRTFLPRRNHPLTETIDWQTVRVQEIVSDDQTEAGRIPRTIDCELDQDLVDSAVPGDKVSVSGIVKVSSSDEGNRGGGGRQKDKCIFQLYLHTVSLTNSKGMKSAANLSSTINGGAESLEGSGVDMEFTTKDLYAIQEIHAEKNLFRLLVGSLCPTIYGHELVKAGLILALFGGSQKFVNDKNRIPIRGDPHVLVVGDPGLGKSQMLQALSGIAPRSVYVCANTSTTSGLTVTLSKEAGSGGGDYALEAGALVLADQGCCCIDEFDKMGNQHHALLEAMEQQTISIAKAGIVCSLPARTSVVAAANPVGGHYNKSKTVSENLRMGSALLSRFDLVFILLDRPDEDMDSRLSEYVMSMHAGGSNRSFASTSSLLHKTQEDSGLSMSLDPDRSLCERLKVPKNEPFDPLPPSVFKKYVGYARKYVHPKLGTAAASVLQKFYLDLRRKHQTRDSTPVTTRQLESLIRLTEARTRLELREDCTEDDARDVIEIMKYSMIDTYSDELGFLDFRRSQHGSGMSKKAQVKRFMAALQRVAQSKCNSLFNLADLKQVSKDAGVQVDNFETFLMSLNDQGYLLKKGPKLYQLQTAEY